MANTNAPLWQDVTVTSGGATNTGGLPFPANSQALTYDLDGNLTHDGTWTYEWDAENRLIAMTMTNIPSLANSNRLRLGFAYDLQGRRIQKTVSTWDGSTFLPQATNRFVHDGWNLVAEFLALGPPELGLIRSYVWAGPQWYDGPSGRRRRAPTVDIPRRLEYEWSCELQWKWRRCRPHQSRGPLENRPLRVFAVR